MLAVPGVAPAVNIAWHVAVPTVVLAARVHGLPVNDPVTPVSLNVTVPSGVRTVPAVDESTTFAVQVVVPPVAIETGAQATLVVVVRRFTTTVVAALVLPL